MLHDIISLASKGNYIISTSAIPPARTLAVTPDPDSLAFCLAPVRVSRPISSTDGLEYFWANAGRARAPTLAVNLNSFAVCLASVAERSSIRGTDWPRPSPAIALPVRSRVIIGTRAFSLAVHLNLLTIGMAAA